MAGSRHWLAGGGLIVAAACAIACSSNSNGNSGSVRANTAAATSSVPSVAAAAAGGTAPPAATGSIAMCPPIGSARTLTGAGSTFDSPLFGKLFDVYNQQCGVQVNYQSVGSGAGIQQLTQKTVQFGASDAPMTDEQIGAAGGDVLHIPVTIGAVAVGYNLPGVKSGIKLTGDVLSRIFLGTIKKWNDPSLVALNAGVSLPDLEIAVVHRSDGSGTSFIFTSYLAAVSTDWQAKVGAGTSVNWPAGAGGKGSEGVAGLVKQTPGAIGYFELAYAAQNNLSVASIQNRAGAFVPPSVDGASAAAAGGAASLPPDLRAVFVNADGGQSYPISGFSWVVINQAQPDAKVASALVSVLWWLVHDGQRFARDLSYAPLPDAVVQLDERQLQKVSVNGQPVLAR